MLQKLISLGILVLFSCAALLTGRRLMARFVHVVDSGMAWVLGAGLSVAIFIQILLILGIAGLFSAVTLNAFLCIYVFWAVTAAWRNTAIKSEILQLKMRLREWGETCPILLFGILFISGFALIGIFSPETDNDSLCYHMHLAKLFLKNHKLVFDRYEWNSAFPLGLELLYAFGLSVGKIYLAKGLHFFLALLTTVAIYLFLRKRVDSITSQLAALVYLSAPAVLGGAVTTYIDVGLAAFTFFAGMSLFYSAFSSASLGLVVISGFFLGTALGIKFLAAISGLTFVLILLVEGVILRKIGFSLKKITVLSLVAFAVGAFWYFRSWMLRGNPVFPYFYSIFKTGDASIHYDDIGVAKTLLNFVTIPWTFTVRPDLFEGYAVQFGIYFLIFIPFAWKCRQLPWVRWMSLFSFSFITGWFLLAQDLRFLLPCFPFMILLAAAGHSWLLEGARWERKAVLGVVFGLIALNILFAAYYFRTTWKVALGFTSEAAFLSRTQRSFPMAQFINQNLSPEAKIFSSDETHLFYYDRSVTREVSFQNVHSIKLSELTPQEWVSRLKGLGYTHLLTVESASNQTKAGGCTSIACLIQTRELAVAEHLKPLYNYDFNYTDQGVFRYQLYEIL